MACRDLFLAGGMVDSVHCARGFGNLSGITDGETPAPQAHSYEGLPGVLSLLPGA